MRITLLCTNEDHPVLPVLQSWKLRKVTEGHQVSVCLDREEVDRGDVLFLISCAQAIREIERQRFRATLVLHASDLPRDRGWSPHVWNVIEGERRITVSLLEARDPVDTGDIWFTTSFDLEGHELLDEINEKLFAAELALMDRAVAEFGKVSPTPQRGEPGEYRRKRTPADSRIDPELTLAEQFDLLRIVDNVRYPAFFDYRGARYTLKIEKARDG